MSDRDIIITTRGLGDDEIAAVVSVVRATIEEELTDGDAGEGRADRSPRRWRRVIDRRLGEGVGWGLEGLGGDREWR